MTRPKKKKKREPVAAVADAVPVFTSFYTTHHINPTVVDKRRQLNALAPVAWFLREITPAQITPAVVTGYVQKRTGEGIALPTIRRELNALKAALNFCVKHRLLPPGDMPHIMLPPASPPRDFFLSASEADTLIKFAQSDIEDVLTGRLTRQARFVLIALGTGSRRNAIEELTWDLVDFPNRVIRFDRLPGKAITKKRRVAVPICDWLLADMLVMFRSAKTKYVLDTDSEITLENFLRRASLGTGCDVLSYIYPHCLRHTVATLALKSGASIYEVARLLGDRVSTIETTYAHHIPGHDSAAVNWRSKV